ncbi:MAG: hypothetical protein AAGF75_14435, partial [Cyanobacteria bacterium P01_H01_bin.130]
IRSPPYSIVPFTSGQKNIQLLTLLSRQRNLLQATPLVPRPILTEIWKSRRVRDKVEAFCRPNALH